MVILAVGRRDNSVFAFSDPNVDTAKKKKKKISKRLIII